MRSTTTLRISTAPLNPPSSGGGTSNIAFLDGAAGGPNASAALMDATFWIEEIVEAGGAVRHQLQYSQRVLLNFNGLSWLAAQPTRSASAVVDAFSLNYRVILAEEGCFDRSEASHAVSLCDMHAKYADVVPMAAILSYFDQLPADLFDLPTGGRSPATPVREAAE